VANIVSEAGTDDRRAVARRISLYFAAFFVLPGIHLPFFSVWLNSRGLSATEISVIVSAGIVLRLLAGPMAAHLVDRSGRGRQAIVLLSWVSLAIYAPLGWVEGFWPILAICLLFAASMTPILPFSENIALQAGTLYGLQYGRLRLWGSLSFLVTAYFAGLFLEGRNEQWIYYLALGGLMFQVFGSHLLPDMSVPRDRPRPAGAPALRLFRSKFFLAFLGANACLLASHAMFFTFGTLHWRSVGLSDAEIGFLWAEGVLAEVILFAFGQRVAQRVGGLGLMALAVLGGLIRWSLTAVVADFPTLAALNLLHAATFACAHLGAMRLLAAGVDADASATAQSLYASANAALLAVATLIVGPLFAGFGGLAYLAMLPLSIFGGICVALLWRERASLRFL
jgi:PPP family 3-phenylpropionic acid transporter